MNSLQPTPKLQPTVEFLPDPTRRWLPATDAQKNALDSDADILLLGGAAGSLKTSTILVDLIQERDYPRMRSYFFRRTYSELEGGDSAIDQSQALFSQTGATYNAGSHTWRWPSGAEFYFRHCQHEKDVYKYQGHAMSALGVDESTHWPMNMIRYLITRNRSTDSGLKIRTRLGTNPGNVGHKEHMKMFFNGICPHCEPHKAPPQNELRWDAKWHDGVPLEVELENGQKVSLSVSYVLSRVRDHNLLGAPYIARLKMQNPATAKALLEGCWMLFEGQYFDIWDYKRMVVPIQTIPMAWWQSWWIGADYGYSGSIAAACLFTRAPNGTIYCVGEHPVGDITNVARENVRVFAKNVYTEFAKKQTGQEQARQIEAMYLGPDSWNDRGDEHTLAGQMNESLEEHGLEFIKANNDRAGGAQLLYTMLQNDQFKVADCCRNVIESLESRIHDEKEPVKVQKVISDPLDDFYDCTRYGLYSYMEATGKPAEERIKERAAQIMKNNQDFDKDMALTSSFLQHEKIKREEEEADSEDPVYVGGSARRRMQQRPRR